MSSGNAGSQGFMAGPERQKRQSRWLWWVYLGGGMLSWVGFTIVAVKVQTRRFVRAAVVSFVVCGIAFAAYGIWPPAEDVSPNADPDASVDLSTFNGGWIVVALWTFLIIYGHVLNQDYKKFLRDKDDQDDRRCHSGKAQAVDVPRVEADRYFATQPPGNAPAAVPPNGPEA